MQIALSAPKNCDFLRKGKFLSKTTTMPSGSSLWTELVKELKRI